MIDVVVVRKRWEARDVCSFELRRPDGLALPAFDAGAHIDVEIAGGGIGGGLVRQYSLCNHPDERGRYLIAVLRDPQSRGGSAAMHDAVQEGTCLRIGEPRNLFPLAPAARRSLLFAGGIGITPILGMAERLWSQAADFTLHYCARSAGQAAFLERLAGSPFAGRVLAHFDDGDDRQRLDCPAALAKPEEGLHLYVCGPVGFMDHVIETALRLGWSQEQIHREYFAADPAKGDVGDAFELHLARSGMILPVPQGRTALEVLQDAGIVVPASCEQGVCGTCLTRVLDGIPDHRDRFLTDREQALNDCFTPCCSRSRTATLTIDL